MTKNEEELDSRMSTFQRNREDLVKNKEECLMSRTMSKIKMREKVLDKK